MCQSSIAPVTAIYTYNIGTHTVGRIINRMVINDGFDKVQKQPNEI